ncbi:MAG: hypothetical protein PWQ67_908 [Clostridia bacterium]|nr:hypothetical protein [Clostridia bacterium]MDN5322454.1 hypothetical protein [Clostridia bacterium]
MDFHITAYYLEGFNRFLKTGDLLKEALKIGANFQDLFNPIGFLVV